MMNSPWLFFMHQLPPKPDYLRVKIWRQLQKSGAIQVRNSVYVLPNSDAAYESFGWILKSVQGEGGDGAICEARFIDGLLDTQVEALFSEARNESYREISKAAKELLKMFGKKKAPTDEERSQIETNLQKLKRQCEIVAERDYFGASDRETAQGLLSDLERKCKLQSPGSASIQGKAVALKDLKDRTWVTRRGVHIDRLACAWLIKKFIDEDAKFKFVDSKEYKHKKDELRFDMTDAEFTHEGDDCSFEVIIRRLNLKEPALKELSEIIHDIDLRDEKFQRTEASGVERIVNGIVLNYKDDLVRIERTSEVFDDLYGYFNVKRKGK